MTENPIIETMLCRKSIRKYTDQIPTDETIRQVVRAGQQAPFAYQMCSVLLSRKREQNPFGAPLLFTVCVDSHRMEAVMARRTWKMATNDLSLLLFGIQDASLMAENMVISAESLGMGSCFLGAAPYRAEEIIAEYHLPPRVFPLVQLIVLGNAFGGKIRDARLGVVDYDHGVQSLKIREAFNAVSKLQDATKRHFGRTPF